MSRKKCVRVTCDECGKSQDCLPGDLENGPTISTDLPKGWLLVSAFVKDEWWTIGEAGWFIRPKEPVDDRVLDWLHACSRLCAAGLLDKLSSLLLAVQ